MRRRGGDRKRKRERKKKRNGAAYARRRTFRHVDSLPVSQKRKRITRELQWVLSSRLSTSHAQSLFVLFASCTRRLPWPFTRNRLQIPGFLCILAGHYSAEQLPLLPVEAFALSLSRFSLVIAACVRARAHRYATLFNSLTVQKSEPRFSVIGARRTPGTRDRLTIVSPNSIVVPRGSRKKNFAKKDSSFSSQWYHSTK